LKRKDGISKVRSGHRSCSYATVKIKYADFQTAPPHLPRSCRKFGTDFGVQIIFSFICL
ncbi:hypothetical protein AVEN_123829-1, partial [Araneus ventricosus]